MEYGDFEDFHIVARKAESDRTAELLRAAGVRIQQRVILEIGHPEYVIAVDVTDLKLASEAFRKDFGVGRTFTSSADKGATDAMERSSHNSRTS